MARKKKDSGSKKSGIEIGLLQRHSKVPSTEGFDLFTFHSIPVNRLVVMKL